MLAPFEPNLWVLLLFTVFTVGIVGWLIERYIKYWRKRLEEQAEQEAFLQANAVARNTDKYGMPKKKKKGEYHPFFLAWQASAGMAEKPRASWGVQVWPDARAHAHMHA